MKLAEVNAKLIELTTVRDTLRAALDAGCDDLIACAESPCVCAESRDRIRQRGRRGEWPRTTQLGRSETSAPVKLAIAVITRVR